MPGCERAFSDAIACCLRRRENSCKRGNADKAPTRER